MRVMGCAGRKNTVAAPAALSIFLWTSSFIFLMKQAGAGDASLDYLESHAHLCCPAADFSTETSKNPPQRMAFLVGAMKAGTTFLFDELVTRHPDIKSRTVEKQVPGLLQNQLHGAKEVQFFNKLPMPTSAYDQYLRGFALSGNTTNASLTFIDATPGYMLLPASACRIRATFPDAKIIMLLRDPVQRALSHWNMKQWGKRKKEPFDDEVLTELQKLRLKNCSFERPDSPDTASDRKLRGEQGSGGSEGSRPWKRAPGIPSWTECFRCLFKDCSYHGPAQPGKGNTMQHCRPDVSSEGVLMRGLYVYQLEMWLQHFPPEQLMVINSDQLHDEPELVLDRILKFLGQDPKLKTMKDPSELHAEFTVPKGLKINDAFLVKNSSGWSLPYDNRLGASDEVLQGLIRYYAHANQELYSLLASLGPAAGWEGEFKSEKTMSKVGKGN